VKVKVQEIKDTGEAIDAITRVYNIAPGEDSIPDAIYWAPGDMTRYTVALLKMKPHGSEGVNISTILFVSSGGIYLVIPAPTSEYSQYSVELFLAKFGERYAGWWGGVRPLLAGLGWTPLNARDTDFNTSDANTMGSVLHHRGL
jgi:hypothetical protein